MDKVWWQCQNKVRRDRKGEPVLDEAGNPIPACGRRLWVYEHQSLDGKKCGKCKVGAYEQIATPETAKP